MQCLACGTKDKMLLVDVVRDDPMKAPAFERRIYMCSACRHRAWRLVFSRVKLPITHLPVVTTSTNNPWKGCVAAPSTWEKAVETLRNSQIDLKARAAAAKTATWTKAVEKLRSKQTALAEKAAIASRPELAKPLQQSAVASSSERAPSGPQRAHCTSERHGRTWSQRFKRGSRAACEKLRIGRMVLKILCAVLCLLPVVLFSGSDTRAESSYFCKFTPDVECIVEGATSPVFRCPIDVPKEFMNALRTKNAQTFNVANPEAFRLQLEQFRKQLENPLRKQAEELRKKSPVGDLSLYWEIIAQYSQGISLYKDGMSMYRRGLTI
jgi:hypothetical protein